MSDEEMNAEKIELMVMKQVQPVHDDVIRLSERVKQHDSDIKDLTKHLDEKFKILMKQGVELSKSLATVSTNVNRIRWAFTGAVVVIAAGFAVVKLVLPIFSG